MWQSVAFAQPGEAAAAARQAHQEAGAAGAQQGVHFDVEHTGTGWFWFPLPASPVRWRAPRVSRASLAEAAALRGEIPQPPAIDVRGKSYTYAKAVLRLHDAAVRGDRDELRQGRISGVSTHAQLVKRYQRALLVALNIRREAK